MLPSVPHGSFLLLRYEESVGACLFPLQQPPLPVQASRIAREASVGTDNPVTRNDDGDGIAPNGTAHRLARHAFRTVLPGPLPGNVLVRSGFSIRNGQQ